MPKIKYTSGRGEAVELYGSPFQLSKIDGIGGVEADIQMSKSPFQHGSTYIDSPLQSRFMALEVTIRGSSEEEVTNRRRFISSVFNPINGLGILEFIDATGSKHIKAIAQAVPYFPDGKENRGINFQKALINLVAPNPMFYDASATSIRLEDYVANFAFPFSFPVSFAVRGDVGTVVNVGHAPAPVRITFRGEAVNPQITKVNTGETLRIRRTIPLGWSLVITTDFDNQSVEIISPEGISTNAMGYLDLTAGWSFFNLDIGENKLSFITDGGKPEVFIEYRNQYVGV